MTQTIEEYADGFWAWRVRTQPRSSDDILRVTRPPGWLPEVGHAAIAAHRAQRDTFEPALAELEARVHGSGTVAERVDVRLLRSALNRVTWELDVLRTWAQPATYVEAALGPVFDVLLPPGVDAARLAEVTRFLGNVPAVVAAAEEVLPGVAQAELVDLAVGSLDGVRGRLDRWSPPLRRPTSVTSPRRRPTRWSSSGRSCRACGPAFRPGSPSGVRPSPRSSTTSRASRWTPTR